MNKGITRAFAAAVATGIISTAQASPVYVDFTATVFGGTSVPMDGMVLGDSVSGGFNFETDRFGRGDVAGLTYFMDWQPPIDPTLPLAFFQSSNRNVTLPAQSALNYNAVNFSHSCQDIFSCPQPYISYVTLVSVSNDRPAEGVAADFTGTLRSTVLQVSVGFESPGLTPEELLANLSSLDFVYNLGMYEETTTQCVQGVCGDGDNRALSFTVDSYAVGFGPRTSVYEPATLGMMGAGLLGFLAARRRRGANANR